MDDLLQQGITAYKTGKRDEARKIFITTIKQNPNNEIAWGWMFEVSKDDKERIYCLQQILRINPNNEKAQQKLVAINGQEFPFQSDTISQTTKNYGNTNRKQSRTQKIQTTLIGVMLLVVAILVGAVIIMLDSSRLNLSNPQLNPPSIALPTSTIVLQTPTQKSEKVPLALEQYGFFVTETDGNITTYGTSCGVSAIWERSKPQSLFFSIPLESSVCDATAVTEPVMYSIYTLYPTSTGDWLIETMQDNGKMTAILLGKTISERVSGYSLMLYFDQEVYSLYYFILAPGDS